MTCHKKCLYCPYPDCLNDDYGPEDLDAVIDAEKCAGIYTKEDEEHYDAELFFAYINACCKASQRANAAERKFRERTRTIIAKIQNDEEN